MPMDGFIPISRKFFEHPFWNQRREFSKAEAWMDLIQSARWQDGDGQVMVKEQIVTFSRGQLIASTRYLKQRWNWKSNSKVETFLKLLEKQDMIRTDVEQKIRRITLCKYDTYNGGKDADRTQVEHKTGRSKDGDRTNIKKDNKVITKKERNIVPPELDWVVAYFKEKGHSTNEAQKFFDHFEVRGWIPKGYKTKGKDWQAMSRNWFKNVDRFGGAQNGTATSTFTGKARIHDYRNE